MTVKSIAPCVSIVLLFLFSSASVHSRTAPSLQKGIEAYKLENYEEAIVLLKKARHENPESTLAAFFLGLAYKSSINYPEATKHLRVAVTKTPKIKEAIIGILHF